MDKKLPKVFANNLKEVHNNETIFYSADERKSSDIKDVPMLKGRTVDQKIREIFASSNYIYKADVDITLDNGVVSKRIIGRNHNQLITMDNEVIPIDKIKDIKYR